MYRALVIDDDADLRYVLASALTAHDYLVDQAKDGEEGLTRIQAGHYDFVLLDMQMPRLGGVAALKQIKAYDPSIVVIVLTAHSNVRDAIEVTKEGAYNYLEKPIKIDNLIYFVGQSLRAKKRITDHSVLALSALSAPTIKLPNGTEFIGQSSEMKRIFWVINKLARVDTAVLIRGESGTGKELVAQALHFNSPRKDNRFVSVNCSAIPENLIESEFFGHEKGSFTGAESRKIGKFQYADGGTLFLDEIGDISAAMQAKLLRALQEKTFSPVGSNREVGVNLRVVAATNRNLEEMIKRGEFREDLFYRLNVLPIYLPPLRERKSDIESLAHYFIDKFNQRHQKKISQVSEETMTLLKSHAWPGNIRELENVIEHAFVIEVTSQITLGSLPDSLTQKKSPYYSRTGLGPLFSLPSRGRSPLGGPFGKVDPNSDENEAFRDAFDLDQLDFQAHKEEFERQFLRRALSVFRGKINQTALHAKIPKKTLLRKLEKYGISAKDYFKF